MRRTKLVLAAAALLVAMLMAFSAPAMTDKGDHNGKNNNGGHTPSEVDIKWILFFTDLFSEHR
jgi:Spy/CpxP family protein refolding chaperone